MKVRNASVVLAVMAIGASQLSLSASPANGDAAQASSDQSWASIQKRRQIVPRVAAHQHLMSPAAVPKPPESLPAVKLPADLDRLLHAREKLSAGDSMSDVFTEDAAILSAEGHRWVLGQTSVKNELTELRPGLQYVPNAYADAGSSGYIAGTARAADLGSDWQSFLFALTKGADGKWRIAAETDTRISPPEFRKPVTADELVRELDYAGIERGVVLSIAYQYASPRNAPDANEYARVRAENDWTAAQVARYPKRLVFFCGVNPLRDYAIEELERCAKMPLMKGMKLHFTNSEVDLRNPAHLENVRKFFGAANDHHLAIVVHLKSLRGDYGRKDSEIVLKELLPVARDIPVQIAHLAGWGGYGPADDETMAPYAEALAAGDPRTKNLYFDACTTVFRFTDDKTAQMIARRVRQVGLQRVFFGSDMVTQPGMVGSSWEAFRTRLPLTNEELQTIANNVPPYLR